MVYFSIHYKHIKTYNLLEYRVKITHDLHLVAHPIRDSALQPEGRFDNIGNNGNADFKIMPKQNTRLQTQNDDFSKYPRKYPGANHLTPKPSVYKNIAQNSAKYLILIENRIEMAKTSSPSMNSNFL